MPRFFANAFDIKEDGIVLTGENMHHLIKVLRHKKGDEIIVCDGAGFDYLCVISDIKEDKVNLKILDKYESSGDPEIKISLFQGVPKGDKFSLIVEKCVEAGVYDITPVNMARCISRLSPKDFSKKKERFEKISLSASKQSGRGTVPNINELIEFDEFIDRKDKFDLVVFPYEEAKDKTLKSVIKDFKGKKIAFFAILATVMVPFHTIMLPVYIITLKLKLVDSYGDIMGYLGLIIPFAVGAFGIFLLRQAFLSIPREIEESAVVDGCNSFQIFMLLLPMIKPQLALLAIFTFIGSWGDFLWPSIVLTNENPFGFYYMIGHPNHVKAILLNSRTQR